MKPLPTVAEAYRKITGVDPASGKKTGAEYAVPCVNRSAHNHGDRNPSLHINPVKDTWVCRACSESGGRSLALVKFAGLAKTDAEALTYLGVESARDQTTEYASKTQVAVYPYCDADGQVRYEVVRYEPKDFRQRHIASDGRVVWNLDGVSRIPYRLPELAQAIGSGRSIVVVEGEKDADALAELGFVATTNAGGAGWGWTKDFVEFFRGAKRVIVVSDNDDAGRTAARARANKLREYASDVRLIEFLPDVERKGDISDLIAQGYNAAKLRALFERSEPVRGRVESITDVLRRQRNAPPPPPPIRTGFGPIDRIMGGLRPGQTSVFGARPGMGKSIVAEQISVDVSLRNKVLLFTTEMGVDRTTDRIVARLSGRKLSDYMDNGGRKAYDPERFKEFNLGLCADNSIADIRELVMVQKPELVIIDHARELEGWLDTSGNGRTDLAPAAIMREIVVLGIQSGAHMILMSQIARPSGDSKPRRPSLSDLRDSGAVEEKADNVFFIHRPFCQSVNEKDDIVELISWKSREAGVFIGHMRFTGELMLFDNPPEEARVYFERCCSGGNVKSVPA